MPRSKTMKRGKEDMLDHLCDYQLYLDEFRREHEQKMESLDRTLEVILSQISCEEQMVRMVTTDINQTLEYSMQKELEKTFKSNSTASSDKSRKRSRSCIVEDEGYLTEDSRGRKLKVLRKSRSLSRANLTVTFQASTKKGVPQSASRVSRPRFRTPMTPFNNTLSMSQRVMTAITPKVNPNRPLTLLRRPKQGEIAVSMQGSPLMVSSMGNDYTANVNIPLNNGTMLSLLPTKMSHVDPKSLPAIDTPTRKQLMGLVANLNTIVKISEQAK